MALREVEDYAGPVLCKGSQRQPLTSREADELRRSQETSAFVEIQIHERKRTKGQKQPHADCLILLADGSYLLEEWISYSVCMATISRYSGLTRSGAFPVYVYPVEAEAFQLKVGPFIK